MADKMMRVAGRGDDGTAKAIKTDDYGRIETSELLRRKVLDNHVVVSYGETFESKKFWSRGFSFGRLVLYFALTRDIEIILVERDPTNQEEKERVIFSGKADSHVAVNFSINSRSFYYKIKAKSSSGVYIYNDSYELLSNVPLDDGIDENRSLFDFDRLIQKGESVNSPTLKSEGNLYGILNLRFTLSRRVKIDIVYLDDSPLSDVKYTENLYDGTGSHSISVEFKMKSEKYYFVISTESDSGLFVYKTSFVTMFKSPPLTDNFISKTITEPLKNAIKNSESTANINNNTRPLKYPDDSLVFKESPIEINTLTRGTDGYFYVIDSSGVVKKYESIIDDNNPLETGITWNNSLYGSVVYFFVADDGVVYFTNVGGDYNSVARIYRSDTINDTPQLVHESDNSVSQRWTRRFGVDRYFNGTSYFLAGTYYIAGPEQRRRPRELVLSVDGGRTFKVVKHTSNLDDSNTYNSHWHDVEIDYHHGLLWACEGDGRINHHVYYSEDMGETWNVVADDMQPTSITSFPDKVIFGRDYGPVGIDGINYPKDINDLKKGIIQPVKEMKTQRSVFYFAMKAVRLKDEAYMGFFLHESGEAPMIMATGDFGESWHGVWIGAKQDEMYRIIEIDDKYIYAYKKRYSNDRILYAKKPKWI